MRRLVGPYVCALLAAALAAGRAAPQSLVESRDRFVETDKDVIGLPPPDLIAAPLVRSVWVSPTGRCVLANRETMRITAETLKQASQTQHAPSGETSLVMWEARSRTSWEAWKAPLERTSVRQVAWLPQTDVALAVVNEAVPIDPAKPDAGTQSEQVLLRLSGASARAETLGATNQAAGGWIDLNVSPAQPLAIVHEMRGDGAGTPGDRLFVITNNGRLGAKVDVPADAFVAGVDWDAVGNPVVGIGHRDPGAKPMVQWYALDPITGATTRLDKRPKSFAQVHAPAADAAKIHLTTTTIAATPGAKSPHIALLWLESAVDSEQPRALVASDASDAELVPGQNLLVYRAQGAAWAIPLFHLDVAQFRAMRDAAMRTVAISNAKQLGLALLMYAQDYNEVLPSGDVNSLIMPYLKNADLFNGFTYTYPGGPLSGTASPAETEIGFVNGPGGQAVMYADGHVKWRGN